jgi:hypothetical protein
LIVKSYTLPDLAYFQKIKNEDFILVDTHENYQKKSFRNKYQILGANGPLSLSIPLKKGKANQVNIKDVLVAYDEDWVKNHLESIRSAYGKSAYFEHYYAPIEIILNRKKASLYELNLDLLSYCIKSLKWGIKVEESTTFIKTFEIEYKTKPYPQVFEDKHQFTPNLSIIDLLFNMGPEARFYL